MHKIYFFSLILPLTISINCMQLEKTSLKGFNDNFKMASGTMSLEDIQDAIVAKMQALSKKNNINAQDDAGFTILMYATILGHKKFIKYLLCNGAYPYLQSKAGTTALMIAEEFEHQEVVQLLEEAENAYKINQ